MNGYLRAWDLAGTSMVLQDSHQLANSHSAVGIGIHEQTNTLFITYEGRRYIRVIDAITLQSSNDVVCPGARNLAGIVVNNVNGHVYAIDRNSNRFFDYSWDGTSLTLSGQYLLPGTSKAYAIALDEVNQVLYVSDVNTPNSTGKINYYNCNNFNSLAGSINTTNPISGIEYDPVSNSIFYASGHRSSMQTIGKYNLNQQTETINNIGITLLGIAVDTRTGYVYASSYRFGTNQNLERRILVFDNQLNYLNRTYFVVRPSDVHMVNTVAYNPLDLYTENNAGGECIYPADTVTYTIIYSNTRNYSVIHNAFISLKIPPYMSFVSASDSGFYADTSKSVHWLLGDLELNTPADTLTVKLKIHDTLAEYTTIKLETIIDADEIGQTTHRDYLDVYYCDTSFYLGNDTSICPTDSVTLLAYGYGFQSYLWSDSSTTHHLIAKDSGYYHVRIKTRKGFYIYDTIHIAHNDNPLVDFSINDSVQCFNGQQFNFTNQSTATDGTLDSFYWDLVEMDSIISTDVSNHVFSRPGSYMVKLHARSSLRCSDSAIKPVIVHPSPKAYFYVNDEAQCAGNNFYQLYDTSVVDNDSIIFRKWDLGDSTIIYSSDTSHEYRSSGTFPVKLVVSSSQNCPDSVSRHVHVMPNPTADFNINDPDQCLSGNHFVFSNASNISSGQIVTNSWFLDDTSFQSQNLFHGFSTPDTYLVKLVTTSDSTCLDSTSKPVYVRPMPVSRFSVNDSAQCLEINNYVFTNFSSIVYGNLSYFWQFGDGTSDSTQHAQHLYLSPGSKQVSLISTSEYGCADSSRQSVYVISRPVADFSINNSSQCYINNHFIFTNASTINEGIINSYQWYINDTFYSSAVDTTGAFQYPGEYDITLVISSSYGCLDSLTKRIHVHPMPLADFSINDSIQCFAQQDFGFSNHSTISNGILTYLWKFGDNLSDTIANPSHHYNQFGNYRISLKAISQYGCIDSIKRDVYVLESPVTSLNISIIDSCLQTNAVNCRSNSLLVNDSITQYYWNFDDGNSSALKNVSHQYQGIGSFNLSLISTTNNSCSDTVYQTINIHPNPITSFAIADSEQCLLNNLFEFTNHSTIANGTLAQQWFIDNQPIDSNKDFSHRFNSHDTFEIKLVSVSNQLCQDSLSQKVYVRPMPVANFKMNDSSQCFENNHFIFTNKSQIDYGNFSSHWSFGDAHTDTSFNTSHSYNYADTFDVQLTIVSEYGCRDHLVRQTIIHVHPMPKAIFTINDSNQCLSRNQFVLNNQSSISSGVLTYYWNFDDGNQSNKENPTHSYSNPDTFEIKLLVESDFGCRDSIIKVAITRKHPVALFSINDSLQCLRNNYFGFYNHSIANAGFIQDNSWYIDGQVHNSKDATYSFPTADTFPIKLKVTSDHHCSDSVEKFIIVYPQPEANFSINDSAQCLDSNVFIFKNLSDYPNCINKHTKWYHQAVVISQDQDSINKSFPVADTHTISFVTITTDGCDDSVTRKIITFPEPNMDFDIPDSIQCFNEHTFEFINNSSITHGALDYKWYFGDGNRSDLANPPLYKYLKTGKYPVRLVGKSQHGCFADLTRFITIHPNPKADFEINNPVQCLSGNHFEFYDRTTIDSGGYSLLWSILNNDYPISGPDMDFDYQFSDTGYYLITLKAISDLHCSDSFAQTIRVNPMPIAEFSYGMPCLGDSTSFFDESSISHGKINDWKWYFESGNSNLQNPKFLHNTPGLKTVKLKVTSSENCSDSTSQKVYYHDYPESPVIIFASVLDNKDIEVSIGKQTSGFINLYEIERGFDKTSFNKITEVDHNEHYFVDQDMDVQNISYSYRARAIDSCQNGSYSMNIGKTILLKAIDTTEKTFLYWTKYEKWLGGVQHYEVYKLDKKQGDYKLIGYATDSFYSDESELLSQDENCFYVVAYGSDPKEKSYSNSVCVPTTFSLFIPNSFTPNKDGLNDYFEVKGKYIIDFEIRIFNNWGEEVFYSNDINKHWDGTFKGADCPLGSYYYQIVAHGTGTQSISKKGTLTLLK